MNTKVLGGVLLLVGTSIGGAMLALPVSLSQSGFFPSTLLLIAGWVIMTYSAFLILEVNLWLPPNNNIISMAKVTLGDAGALVAWFVYLFLFYCLLAAYISAGSDILRDFLSLMNVNMPFWMAASLFLLLLGGVVFNGIRSVDYVNRGLMFGKLGAFLGLVLAIIGFVKFDQLVLSDHNYLAGSVSIVITSFGYGTIIPSLRTYYHDDIPALRKTIIIGSAIPLICYIVWLFAIMGVIPVNGEYGLTQMITSGHQTTDIPRSLSHLLNNPIITIIARLFFSVGVATAFLGVSLSMTDFMADGLSIEKKGYGKMFVFAAVFLPPFVIALFFPNAFLKGLSYAGILCAILLAFFPAFMAWGGRYNKKLHKKDAYQVKGGKLPVMLTMMAAFVIVGISLMHDF